VSQILTSDWADWMIFPSQRVGKTVLVRLRNDRPPSKPPSGAQMEGAFHILEETHEAAA
jgi:hypothetical protein